MAKPAEPRRVSMSRFSHACADGSAHQARANPNDTVTMARWLLGKVLVRMRLVG
jgi:hypothetical protein